MGDHPVIQVNPDYSRVTLAGIGSDETTLTEAIFPFLMRDTILSAAGR